MRKLPIQRSGAANLDLDFDCESRPSSDRRPERGTRKAPETMWLVGGWLAAGGWRPSAPVVVVVMLRNIELGFCAAEQCFFSEFLLPIPPPYIFVYSGSLPLSLSLSVAWGFSSHVYVCMYVSMYVCVCVHPSSAAMTFLAPRISFSCLRHALSITWAQRRRRRRRPGAGLIRLFFVFCLVGRVEKRANKEFERSVAVRRTGLALPLFNYVWARQ